MDYTIDYLLEYLPEGHPPDRLIPPGVTREAEIWMDSEDEIYSNIVTKSMKWTYAIFSELGLGHYEWEPPAQLHVMLRNYFPLILNDLPYEASIGLYDPKSESTGFGITIRVPSLDGLDFLEIGNIHFPRLKIRLPLAMRVARDELHAMPNPRGAVATCWGRCNRTDALGIVTAGHTFEGVRLRSIFPMEDGSHGLLLRNYWKAVDAAFVATTAAPPCLQRLSILQFPAAGQRVDVQCRTGSKSRNVIEVFNTLGFYKTRTYSIFFFLDKPCSPGDSGALVRIPKGDGIGIYCGSQPSPSIGGSCGRALILAQAAFALDITTFI